MNKSVKIEYRDLDGGISSTPGFLGAGINCGIKDSKQDLALVYSEVPARLGAVFTTNQIKAAPVLLGQKLRERGLAQALVINSGNANACTGEQGLANVQQVIEWSAQALNIAPELVFPSSTGIIGQQLAMDKLESGIKKISDSLTPDGGSQAAWAIMTTDTYPKEIALAMDIGGEEIVIGGMAKGSGMIEPNMATMLAFLSTNLNISQPLLQEALVEAVEESFNRITVDGDQSTNDTVAILANAQAANQELELKDEDYYKFLQLLKIVTKYLAQQIVRDGEGATKFVEIEVLGALSFTDAKLIAKSIANSKLVKTALFGEDPNWGRIVAAAGYAGAQLELDKLTIAINEQQLFANQQPAAKEEQLEELLAQDEIKISVDLNLGPGRAQVWTCDLSYKYIEINAEYHT